MSPFPSASYTPNTEQDIAGRLIGALQGALGVPIYGERGYSSVYGGNFDLQSNGGGIYVAP